eukprot:5182575-Amphidinium_carterae.1
MNTIGWQAHLANGSECGTSLGLVPSYVMPSRRKKELFAKGLDHLRQVPKVAALELEAKKLREGIAELEAARHSPPNH